MHMVKRKEQLPAFSRFALALALAASITLAADKPAKEEADAADRKLQQGTWKHTEASLGGEPVPAGQLSAITLKLFGDRYELTVEGEPRPDKGTCVLDATSTPKRMQITSDEGPNKGKTFLAIYEFKGDAVMRICYDLSGTQYPKAFSSAKGAPLYLVTYQRKRE